MGGMGLIFTPVLVRHLLGPLGLSGPMTSTFRTHRYPQTVLLEGTTHLRLPTRSLVHAIHDITVVLKEVAQNPAVLASYYIEVAIKH